MVSLREAQESLKTRVVDSPEKLRNYKEKMKDTVQRLKKSRVSLPPRQPLLPAGGCVRPGASAHAAARPGGRGEERVECP